MEEYKINYNKLLKRYYNGVKYLEDNPNEVDKWIDELLDIVDELDKYVGKFNIPDENILGGF